MCRQYLVSGIDFPHNLALTPAPLQVSGAGESVMWWPVSVKAVAALERSDGIAPALSAHRPLLLPAGERKLAVLVSDIHESGPKLKKFVFNAGASVCYPKRTHLLIALAAVVRFHMPVSQLYRTTLPVPCCSDRCCQDRRCRQ